MTNLKTINELHEMTIKELRNYMILNIDNYVPKTNWHKSEIILAIINLIGIKQN